MKKMVFGAINEWQNSISAYPRQFSQQNTEKCVLKSEQIQKTLFRLSLFEFSLTSGYNLTFVGFSLEVMNIHAKNLF